MPGLSRCGSPRTNKIAIELDVDALSAAIAKQLVVEPGHFAKNPLTKIVADAIIAKAELLAKTINDIAAGFIASEEFARRIRGIYRDALCGEAARMGRNAARVAINAKDDKP